MNYNLLSEYILTGRVSTISFIKTFQDNPYKEKSKSREKKKDYSEQRRKKREFEWDNLWLKKTT